jgi:ABC-type multidrug transport system fused ATPase/permease subunit
VSLAAVTAATLYTQQLLVPVDRMLFWLNEIQTGGAALARVIGIECHRPEAHTEGDHDVPQANDVRVRGLTYAYRAGRDVLRALELDVAPGERLAVVGPSGAGKSTLGRLLAGIYRPRTGTITAGGASLSDLPFERLRQQVALVTQEHHVFRATLRENVAMVRPDVTDDELERALRAVGAWEWARPLGLDTPLGAGRVELSPAHAQQLALARIVVAAPHTLVLDEATAFLTPQAARALEQSLQSVLSGRTVIAIAHRLHTAHDADRIAMMLDGRIVETGSHNQLIERGERYAALWESWCRGSEEPAGNIN